MSDLSAYKDMAPVTVDRLIDLINSILEERGLLAITKRTLRFYTAQAIVPRPMGSPKYARYNYHHLLAIVAARALQDQGNKLDIIVQELKLIKTRPEHVERIAENWLQQQPLAVGTVREKTAEYGDAAPAAKGRKVGNKGQTIRLTPNSTLLVEGSVDMETELKKVLAAVKNLDHGVF